MYYVPDGTKECGYYECKKCGNRFLSMQTMKRIPCPDCEAEIDYEIGPDESLEDVLDTAELIQKMEGEEEPVFTDTFYGRNYLHTFRTDTLCFADGDQSFSTSRSVRISITFV